MNKTLAPIRSQTHAVWLLLPLVALFFCGCRSAHQPASASFASTVIPHRGVEEIRQAAMVVFTEAGYAAFVSTDGALLFEKEGTRKNQIMHGGWIDDRPIRERVRAELVALPDGSQRLQCKAYMVVDAGSLTEDEKRLPNFRAKPYQKLLDDVAKRLK